MISNFIEYSYSNKVIPISTDSTVLKVAKVSGLIFLGLCALFLNCTRKLLAYRNIIQKKDSSNLSPLIEDRLGSTEKMQNTSVVDQISTETDIDKYLEHLLTQRKALEEYLKKTFQVTPETFLNNLRLFVAKPSIDFKLVPLSKEGPLPIHVHLIKVIEGLLKEYSNNELSNGYREYTCALRDAINTKEYKNNECIELSSLLQELCFAKFVYTVLTDLQEKTLKSVIKSDPLQNNMTLQDVSGWIEKDNETLRKQPKGVRQSFSLNYEKARNAAGINSDQLSSANIPELRSIHKVKQNSKEYSIYYLRYPTPTIETLKSFQARFRGANTTIIAPEFLGFLDGIQRKKIPFLYVNHQYMDGSSLSAANNRAEIIQGLEETYIKDFHFLSLPFDGPIIDKIDKETLIKWKESLVIDLIKEKNGFKIPKKFKKFSTNKREEVEQLLNKLHELYFPGKSELNKTERRVLLVVFYSYLKEYFKSEYQIRIIASVCKDNKDRGNVSACIDETLFNLRLGKENDPRVLKDLHLRILSPFIFRNEGIVEHRLKFLKDLLDHIATLGDKQKEEIRIFEINQQRQIIDQWIPRSNDCIIV